MRKTIQARSNVHSLPRPWMTLGSAPQVESGAEACTRRLDVQVASSPVASKGGKKGKADKLVATTACDTVVTNFFVDGVNNVTEKGSILLNNDCDVSTAAPSPATLHSQWEDPVLVHVDDYLQRSVRLQKKMYDKYRRVTNAADVKEATAAPIKGKKKAVSPEAYNPAADGYVSEFDSDKCGVVEMEVRLGQLGFTRNVTVDARNQSLWESTVEDAAEKKPVAKKTVNAHTNEETSAASQAQQQQQRHRQLQAQKRQGFRVATAPIESAAVLENNTYMFNSGFRVLSSCDEFFSIPFKVPFRGNKKQGFTILCVERSTRRTNTKGIRKVIGFNFWSRLFTRDLTSQKRAWLVAAYQAAFISIDDRSYNEIRTAVDDYLRVSQPERYSDTVMASRADSAENRGDDTADDFEAADAAVNPTAGEEGEDGIEDELVGEGGLPQTREEAIAICREYVSRRIRTFSFAATEAATAAQRKLQQHTQSLKPSAASAGDKEESSPYGGKLLMTSEEAEDHQAMRMNELLKEGDAEMRGLQQTPKERFVGVSKSHDEDIPKNAITWRQRRQFDLLIRRPGEISMDGSDEMIHPPMTWGRVGATSPAEFFKATGATLEPKKPVLEESASIVNLPAPDVLHPKHLDAGTTFEAHALTDDGYRLEFTGGVPLVAVLDAKANQLSILMTAPHSSTNTSNNNGPQSPLLRGADQQSTDLIAHLQSKYNVEEVVFDTFVIEPGQEQTKYSYIKKYVERKLAEGDITELDTSQLMLLPRRRPLDVLATDTTAEKSGFGGGGSAKGSKPLADSLLIKDVAIDFSAPIKKKVVEEKPVAEVSIFNTQPTTPVDLYILREYSREHSDKVTDDSEVEALYSNNKGSTTKTADEALSPRPSTLESDSFIGGESTMIAFTHPRTVRKSAVSHFDIRQPRWCADARISVSIERTHEEANGEQLPPPSKMVPSEVDLMLHRTQGTEEEENQWAERMGRSIAVTRLRKRMMFHHFRVLPVLSGVTVGLTPAETSYQAAITRIAAATQKLSPVIAPHLLRPLTSKPSKKGSSMVSPEAFAQAEKYYESLMSPEDAAYSRVVQYFKPYFFHTQQQQQTQTAPCRRLLRWNLNSAATPATAKRQVANYPTAVEFELGNDIISNEFLRPCITDVVTQRRPRPNRTRLPSHATTLKQLQEEYGASDKKELLALMKEKEDSIGHVPGAIRTGAADGMMCIRTHPTDERSREVEVEVDVAALTKTLMAADRALEYRLSVIAIESSMDASTKEIIATLTRHEHEQRVADLYRIVSRCFMETIGDIAKLS